MVVNERKSWAIKYILSIKIGRQKGGLNFSPLVTNDYQIDYDGKNIEIINFARMAANII